MDFTILMLAFFTSGYLTGYIIGYNRGSNEKTEEEDIKKSLIT